MRALLANKGPWLFVQYIEEFAKNHVRKNEGQLYYYYYYYYFAFVFASIFLNLPLASLTFDLWRLFSFAYEFEWRVGYTI